MKEETTYPDGRTRTLVYSGVNCLGFESDLEYLFEQDKLIAGSYTLRRGQDPREFRRKFEEAYGEYAFKFKLDSMQRYFWDVGGSESYMDLPGSSKDKHPPDLHFISKQYAGFFNNL